MSVALELDELTGAAIDGEGAGSHSEVGADLETVDPAASGAAAREGTEAAAVPVSLPGDQQASAVTPQALALPSAEGSIEGMGESFSPVLSSGTATYSVPIALPAGRAGVQPTLALAYSSTGGNSVVGFGWGLEAPYISRQTDRGLPRYVDGAAWSAQEDRFFYNGGQELVPVSSADTAELDGTGVPSDYATWQQYRARVEGAFMRFFRAPSGRSWAVQGPDGSLLEFGEVTTGLPSDFGTSTAALEAESGEGRGRIFRWFLTRMSDVHGSTVYYRYSETLGGRDGSRYLVDIHYGSPAACGTGGNTVVDATARRRCTQPLAGYGRRVRFLYEPRPDVFSSYVAGWRVDLSQRLTRIVVTSAEAGLEGRFMVRRYHLGYASSGDSFHSLLARVEVEGRPEAADAHSAARVASPNAVPESTLDGSFAILGATLPPLRFSYTQADGASSAVEGFGRISNSAIAAPSSPPHSVDEGMADLFDVNSDGLPDLLVTDPARYRTRSGAPAAGVFFNGFTGSSARPATAGAFSGAVSAAVPSGLSGAFDLSNLNAVPMDIDGDGRSDLLHMPRLANYGYFITSRDADEPIPVVSPADQGWRFAHVPVALPPGVTDPRIDLGRDGQHLRAFDVNNDHLVDVVRTSGTVMQTWLNLGWLPGGDGRFGSARWTGTAWALSTDPVESCVLHAGTPLDFEDPEVRLADMNGDGIQDIVRIRRGRLLYWPGRGEGSWGDGPQRCAPGEGAGRYIEVATPPAEINVELDGVYLEDVNEDGAADVVQVRFDAIDVWFNRAGRSFTSRVIATGTPARPAYLAGRIRFADMDGSGTTDVLYGNANDYRWVDLMGGVKPRLLRAVDNGLGAVTTMTYGSSADEYLRDLRDAASCPAGGGSAACRERFTWSHVDDVCDARVQRLTGECIHRSGGAPLVAQVVTSVSTTDRLDAVGREATATRSDYAFHDGYYEGFEQEFRGFGAADAIAVSTGDYDTHPTGVTRSYFHQGRRPNAISTDRLADNTFESLKARVYMTEAFDPATGRTLSTGHTTHHVRQLLQGLDGRRIWFAYAAATDEFRYDTSLAGGGGTTHTLDSVRMELPESTEVVRTDTVTERWGGAIHLQSRVVTMDNFGHPLESEALGRDGTDEVITTHALPVLLSGADGRWLWRDASAYVTGSDSGSTRFGETEKEYDELGNLVLTQSYANMPSTHPSGFEFLGDLETGPGLTQDDQIIVASSEFDVWGNATASCGGADIGTVGDSACLRYGEVSYDTSYSQFPVSERIAIAAGGDPEDRFLTTAGNWDQGLGVLLQVSDPNELETDVTYDGFGRISTVRPPASGECDRDVPVQWFEYALTTSPSSQPVSIVTAHQENDCSATGADAIVTRTYVDGLGRARASLATSENAGEWIQSGISILNTRGSVRRAYQPARLDSSSPTITRALQIPSVPFEEAGFDAFDRQVARFPAVGGIHFTTFHALSSDECDPLDNDTSSPHYRTCTTSRTDGHGRVIDQILRNRQPDSSTTEYYRLFTHYRADNAVTEIKRAQTTSDTYEASATVVDDHEVLRTFTYDTAGRRIGTTDPDSDSHLGTRDETNSTWRYLFNAVGDLVAVRDPRGCGQDFFYDHAARLVAEDYIRCDESELTDEDSLLELPHDSIGLEVVEAGATIDVLHTFDEVPSWATGSLPSSDYRGRLGGSEDRGQRSAVAYDDRGQVVASARQMAVLPNAVEPTITTVDGLPVITEGSPVAWDRTYDDDHTYVRTASYDHGGRPTAMTLPTDPDYDDGPAPEIGGTLEYNARGLPSRVNMTLDEGSRSIVDELVYTRDGLVEEVHYGDDLEGDGMTARTPTVSFTTYDDRRRPVRMWTQRSPNAHGELEEDRPLEDVSTPHDQMLVWDLADNLIAVEDLRDPTEWPDGFRPQSVAVTHDSLYRVAGAEYEYTSDSGGRTPIDDTSASNDWRTEMAIGRSNDPMRTAPAPLVSDEPDQRVVSMTWEHDWLGNMQSWDDDSAVFYERSLGEIVNGADLPSAAPSRRTGALYVASNLPATPVTADDGGWVEVRYGEDGNALAVTVHGRCGDPAENAIPLDCRTGTDDPEEAVDLSCAYSCATEQHFTYAWDEVNRIAHARRLDREDGGDWELAVEQRYLYDANNQRTVKTTTFRGIESGTERSTLYVYPGDFERRGLVRSSEFSTFGPGRYEAVAGDTETQYGVGGARIVWRTSDRDETLDRDQRITLALTDLIQSTTAVIDLATGELVEAGSFYANGARETYRSNETETVTPEPMGFTGKEADEEVGLTYFGHRYLMAHLGRWASPDPLQTHQVGGGEAVNGYHYVAGNLLQGRDPVGLQDQQGESPDAGAAGDTAEAGEAGADARPMYDEVWLLYDPARMDRTRSRISAGDREAARMGAEVARRWEAQDPTRRHVEYVRTASFDGVADAFERATRSLRPGGTLISDTGHGSPQTLQLVWGQAAVGRRWLYNERQMGVGASEQDFAAWIRIRDAVRAAQLSRWVLAACDTGGGDQFMRDLATFVGTRVVASTVTVANHVEPGSGRAYMFQTRVTLEQYRANPMNTLRNEVPGTRSFDSLPGMHDWSGPLWRGFDPMRRGGAPRFGPPTP